MVLRLATERHSTPPAAPDTTPCNLLDAIATELNFRPLSSSLYAGPCPTCNTGTALAWDFRVQQRPDSFRCLSCLEQGSLHRLWRLSRGINRLAGAAA